MVLSEGLFPRIIRLLISGLAVLLTDYLLSGVAISGFWTSVLVAFLLGIANTYLRPILSLIALPLTILTFGLFLLVINVLMVFLVEWLVPGFSVDSFWWALLFSVIQSLLNALFQGAFQPSE
jgi:putative membrane protein